MVSLSPKQPRTWFRIIAPCWTEKCQNSQPTYFLVMYARANWMRVLQVGLAKPFEDFMQAGAATIFESLVRIHLRTLPLMSLLSKLEWKWRVLKDSRYELMEFNDDEDTPYIQKNVYPNQWGGGCGNAPLALHIHQRQFPYEPCLGIFDAYWLISPLMGCG